MSNGHECAIIPQNVAFCDQIIVEIPPTSSWGKVFYTAPLPTRMSYTVKVLVAYNSTIVDVYRNDTKETHPLNDREYFAKTSSESVHCVIASDKPVLVTEFAHGSRDDDNPFSTGDPMMTMVPQATNQFDSKFQFSTLQGIPGYTHYANIILLADDNL